MYSDNRISFCIVGSGTAGLIASIVLRQAFPFSKITNVYSSKTGIVGVGEGSTEHWRMFMDSCDIGVESLIKNTGATHKYGIRFENWTEKNPDYFHSISGVPEINAWGLIGEYFSYLENEKMITTQTGSIGLVQDKIMRDGLHANTNQFHFDTFMLNDFLIGICFKRNIKFIDDTVISLNLDERGYIDSAVLESGSTVDADVWIDATGFSRALMKMLGNNSWKSFSDYLLVDSAIAFPTESDPSGKIKTYTRARAASSGWMWEIPTQTRRGNGYVYSSQHISDDEAVEEARKISGYDITPLRSFKFDPGYLKNQWYKNCIAVGLSSSFVEPLEATSIGSSIIQAFKLASYCSAYVRGAEKMVNDYNRKTEEMMLNIRDMIRLHYISDRKDSKFWNDVSRMPIPDSLKNLLDLWSELPPGYRDIPETGHHMFTSRHMVHVAQGQGLIPSNPSSIAMDRLNIRFEAEKKADDLRMMRHARELVDHRQALMETVGED